MENLKACPFCGNEVLSVETELNIYGELDGYFVECDICLARGPLEDKRDDAVRMWNNQFAANRIKELESLLSPKNEDDQSS